jgi:hypothetical protein
MKTQRTWRNLSWWGIAFSIAVVNGFLGNAVLFGFTADTLEAALDGRPQPLFPNPAPGQHPLILFYAIVVGLPFTFCGLFHVMRCQVFIDPQAAVLRSFIQGFGLLGLVMGAIINLFFTATELYGGTAAEMRLTTLFNVTAVYFYIWSVGLAGIAFGLEMWRSRHIPRWLAGLSIGSNGAAILIHSLAQNPDFPAFRLIIGLPFVSLDVIVWAFFLWLLSAGPDSESTMGQ